LLRRSRASASAWVRGLISRPAPVEEAPRAPDETAQEAGLISAFLGGVSIQPLNGTRLVNIVYTHTDPHFAALSANALAEEYEKQNLEQRLHDTGQTLEWVTSELEKATLALRAGEERLQQYLEANKALSLDQRQDVVTQQLASLNESAIRARGERMAREN